MYLCSISCNASFVSDFEYSLFFLSLAKSLSGVFLVLFFVVVVFSVLYQCFHFDLYFLPSANFGLSSFLLVLEVYSYGC